MKQFLTLTLSLCLALSSVAAEWAIVTDESSLQSGDKVVIACSSQSATAGPYDASKAMLTAVSTDFFNQNEEISSLGAGTIIFTLGKTATGSWTFTTEEGATLGTTGKLKLQIGGSGVDTWTIAISGGDATITNTNESYGSIQYNANAPRFSCYTSKQTKVQLYRQGVAAPKMRLSYQGFPYKRTSCEYPAYYPGVTIQLAPCPYTNAEGQRVIGWSFKDKVYTPGSAFTMPEEEVELVPVWGEPKQGIENIQSSEPSNRKILRDGQLIILREGKEYNILGGRLL